MHPRNCGSWANSLIWEALGAIGAHDAAQSQFAAGRRRRRQDELSQEGVLADFVTRHSEINEVSGLVSLSSKPDPKKPIVSRPGMNLC